LLIKSGYKWKEDTCKWEIEIPVNSSGEIRLSEPGFESVQIDGSKMPPNNNIFSSEASLRKILLQLSEREIKLNLQVNVKELHIILLFIVVNSIFNTILN
jgi:hypothetical protein